MYEIPGINGDILEKIVDFCYQQRIAIDEDAEDIDALLIAASYLQVPKLEVKCIEYYKNKMNASNCLVIWALAEQYHVAALQKWSESFIARQIKEVVKGAEFLELSEKQLETILKSDQLNVDHEEDVFNALKKWTRFDMQKRKNSFEMLFNNIRLQHCNESVSYP